jgi:hypothetical protein
MYFLENGTNSTNATKSDNTIILAGKPTSIPAFPLAVIPVFNNTTAPRELNPLSRRGATVGDMFSELGTVGLTQLTPPEPQPSVGAAKARRPATSSVASGASLSSYSWNAGVSWEVNRA